jgi:transcriptional regulator with XRE-family HTH domain
MTSAKYRCAAAFPLYPLLDVTDTKETPVRMNQVIATRLREARKLRRMTQADLAERLEPLLGVRWPVTSVSAAEGSVSGKRPREFTADEVTAFARVLELPVPWFFRVPAGVDAVSCGGPQTIAAADIAEMVFPDLSEIPERLRQVVDVQAALIEQQAALIEQLKTTAPITRALVELRKEAGS